MIKRLSKIFLKLTIILVALILVVLLVARILFPPEKLKTMAIFQIESAINRRVTIGHVWLNPFRGISLNEVIVYERNADGVCDSTWFFKVDNVLLKYRFFALLKREIEISKVMVEKPAVNLVQDEFQRWNFDDLISTAVIDSTELTLTNSTAEEFSLPVALDLKELFVKNITANLIVNQPGMALTMKSGGITININDLLLPRKSFEEIKNRAKANLKIYSLDESWKMSLTTDLFPGKIEINTKLQLNLNCGFAGFNDIYGKGELTLTDVNLTHFKDEVNQTELKKFPLPRLLSVSFDLSADLNKELVKLKQLAAEIGDENIFNITGELNQILTDPAINLQVVESEIKLHQLESTFLPLLADTIQKQFESLKIKGIASFVGTKISGCPLSDSLNKSLLFDLNFAIQNLFVDYAEPVANLSNAKLQIKSSGIYNLNGVQKIDLRMQMFIDSLSTVIDTTKFTFGKLSAELAASINEKFLPDSLRAVVKINNFFDVPLNFSINYKLEDGFNRYNAQANLSFFQLPLAVITNSAAEGVVDFSLNVHSQQLDKIDAQMNIFSDIIEVAAEDEPIIIYPMDIVGNLKLSTDTTLQYVKLDSLKMEINDFVSLLMHGNFSVEPEQKLTVSVDELTVDLEKILEIVPEQFLEGIEDLTISGSSTLTSKIDILLDDKAPLIDINGSIAINAKGELPEQYLSLGLIDGQIDFKTNGITGRANMKAVLDSLVMVGVQDEPLHNISVDVSAFMPDFETICVESSSIQIPELKTSVSLTAKIDSLSGQMLVKANSKLFMDTENDTITLLNLMKLSGKITQNTNFVLNGDVADVEGNIQFQNINVNYDQLIQADSMRGIIYFAEKFDVEKGILIERKSALPALADAGFIQYDLLRPYYQHNNQKFSHFYINKIQAMGYHVEHANFDVIIENERMEIPRFSMNLYDGNMSGLINVNIHDGDPEAIEWKIKANVSRMNSAKLLATINGKGKGADLNMNLELAGKGVDPAAEFEVGGYLYVTKIGPKFTDNVLRSLDPKGTDKSIQDTRKLLKWGYKPKLISFEIKHDNLYPSIHLVKGNFLTKLIPLNLSGGKIELARMPVKFFLSNLELGKE